MTAQLTRPVAAQPTTAAPDGSREEWRPGPPLLALATGWIALFAWSGMVDAAARPS